MKKYIIVIGLICTLNAGEEANKTCKDYQKGFEQYLLHNFDLNKNGVLDPQERAFAYRCIRKFIGCVNPLDNVEIDPPAPVVTPPITNTKYTK